MNYEVGQKVRIKDTAPFGLGAIERAFDSAKRQGTVTKIADDGIISVKADNSDEWDYFKAEELERIEVTE